MRTSPTKPPTSKELISDFTAAAIELFNWYDGERSILRHNGYTCPTARGVHGMTMLRTAAIKAQRLRKR